MKCAIIALCKGKSLSANILFFLASLVLRAQRAVSVIGYGSCVLLGITYFNLCLSSAAIMPLKINLEFVNIYNHLQRSQLNEF